MDKILFSLLHPDAFPPTRKHADDAGMDVYANQDVTVPPHSFGVVPTGISVRVPEGCMLDARPKSKSNFLIGAGVIDFGYQGEILIKVANITVEPVIIRRGEAVAQLVASRIVVGQPVQVALEELFEQESGRGPDGGIAREYKRKIGH
jgi:dUTP pyrophosphatase